MDIPLVAKGEGEPIFGEADVQIVVAGPENALRDRILNKAEKLSWQKSHRDEQQLDWKIAIETVRRGEKLAIHLPKDQRQRILRSDELLKS